MHPYWGLRLSANSGTGIKPLLLVYLQQALSLYGRSLPTLKSEILAGALENIPLRKAQDATRILYISAIAFSLAKPWNQPPMDIAVAIAANLSDSAPRLDFAVQVVPPGWIHLQVTDLGLANWLQFLTLGTSALSPISDRLLPNSQSPLDPTSLFAVQYAHARCCSLIRLAHREGTIVLSDPDPDTSPLVWGAIAPNPIPWLNFERSELPETLRLVHPAELRLISHLVTALDALSQPHPTPGLPQDGLKLATSLSQAFEIFYSACRIWGEVKTENLYLAQARIGLLVATQSVLQWMLQNLFCVCAPLEL